MHASKQILFEDWAGWMPRQISYHHGEASITWYQMEGIRFIDPFFDNAFNGLALKRYSDWNTLSKVAKQCTGIAPTGFIFHASRCGSTLVAQALAALQANIVLSEAPLIHDALGMEGTEKAKIARLRDVISILGQRRFEEEANLFIKFDAWSIAELPLILKAYPGVPWVFIYRDPVEIFVSQKRMPGLHMVPGLLRGKLFDQIPKDTDFHDFGPSVITEIFKSAVENLERGGGMAVNYTELPHAIATKIVPFFNLSLSQNDYEKVVNAFTQDAKNPQKKFAEDTQRKQEEASASMKAFAQKHIALYYDRLQVRSIRGRGRYRELYKFFS